MAETNTVALKVAMSCQGCVGAVNRVLTKLEGVESFDINLEQQKVTVRTNLPPDVVLDKVSKSGKKTAFWVEEPKETAPHAKPTDSPAPAPAPAETPEALTPNVQPDPEVKVVPSETPATNAPAPASG